VADAARDITSTFGQGRAGWLTNSDHVRNVVRQELVSSQLAAHVPDRPMHVLDVGAGQGIQSIRLARAGHVVRSVEPDEQMRAAFTAALANEADEVRERVTLVAGSLGSLAEATEGATFDLVLLLGVLMYVPDSSLVLAEVAPLVAAGGVLSIATRTATSALWRPAARQDWTAALAAFDEDDAARREGRDVRYVNEIGAPARADDFDRLVATAAAHGLALENWYGIRTAIDMDERDPEISADDPELNAIIEVEQRLGARDPFRQLSQLAHFIFRRGAAT